MRASIVMVLCAGCGVLGGGGSLDGTWEGQCDAEDDDGNDYNYELTMDLVKSGGGVSEGDGSFDSTLVLTTPTLTTPTVNGTNVYVYYDVEFEFELTGDGDVRAEEAAGEWTIDGNDWAIELDGQDLSDLDTADWTLVGTKDGSTFNGEIEIDLAGEITVRGTCDLDEN